MNLRNKVLVGYFILVVLIGFMASILIHERHRISEIDSQNSEVQQMMLRALETKRYRPIGGNKEKAADVRIIAATNEDMPKRRKY